VFLNKIYSTVSGFFNKTFSYLLINILYFNYNKIFFDLFRLQSQLPDLENTLEMIKIMKAHKGQQLKTDFLLSDDVYIKAHIQGTDNVYLWLGVSETFF